MGIAKREGYSKRSSSRNEHRGLLHDGFDQELNRHGPEGL
jgi:hypothetical protein